MIGSSYARVMILGSCLALAGCGGGDHVASAPTPPSNPSPTYDSFVGLNKDVTLQTTSAATSYSYTSQNGKDPNSITRDPKGGFGEGSVTIGYDAASKTYTLNDGPAQFEARPEYKTSPASGSAATPFDAYVYRDPAGYYGQTGQNLTYTISMYRAGAANTQFPQLSYTTFFILDKEAQFLTSGVSGSRTDVRLVYAIGGFETQLSDLPKAGTASYSTYLTGISVDNGASLVNKVIDGTAKFTADFANASVSTAMSLSAQGQAVGDFTGTAPINAGTSHFAGNLAATGGGNGQGNFSGSFFGPQATEMGYTFRVQTGIGTVDGGVVGKRN